MKKLLLALVLFASAAFAEPSFDEMQNLIAQKNYAAAEQGLELIIQAHPKSAKAFYSMAQAQAGLGHQDKAQFALDKAKGLDPSLKFASESNVEALQTAITPQVKKIEKVESGSHWFLILLSLIAVCITGWLIYVWTRKDHPTPESHFNPEPQPDPKPNSPHDAYGKPPTENISASDRAYMKDHNLNDEARAPRAPRRPQARYANHQAPYVPAGVQPRQGTYSPQPQVVNNHYGSNNGSGDLLTGVMVGSMLNNHHDTTRIVEREVIVERPSYTPSYTPPARDTSWDTPAPSRSSSWDDDSSSSKSSSSWSSSSSDSSSSSSSWDSGSSSSDSSSSSWDS